MLRLLLPDVLRLTHTQLLHGGPPTRRPFGWSLSTMVRMLLKPSLRRSSLQWWHVVESNKSKVGPLHLEFALIMGIIVKQVMTVYRTDQSKIFYIYSRSFCRVYLKSTTNGCLQQTASLHKLGYRH